MDENHFYEAEISPKEVVKFMKVNIYDNFLKNSYFFISSDYIISRSSLFSLIRKISNKMGFKSQTYFLSIYYLDILFLKNKKIDCNFKTLALACLLLSAKFIENDPCVPSLAEFIKVYNNVVGYKYIISATDLFYAEVLACKMLGYKLNYYTIYDFDSFFFGHGIIKIEQLRELNNDNYLSGNNFEINEKNSIYIKKILEKIYRKSRHYLEMIVNNSNICLKYNSLLISIFIMKKSVEEILFDEQRINKYDLLNKEKFLNKTSKCFKQIMNELYLIDYEKMNSYLELISDKDLIKLFQEDKKGDLSPALVDLENNIKLANDNNDKYYTNKQNNIINYRESQNSISAYSYINRIIPSKKYKYNNNSLNKNNNNLNTSLNGSQIMKKINITRNINKYNSNYKNIYSHNSHRLSSIAKYKNKNASLTKRHKLIDNYLDLSNLSSSKDLNIIESNNYNLNNNYNEERTNRVILRNSDISGLKYLQRFITFNNKKSNESNSIRKKHNNSISVENDDDLIDIINSIENKDKNKSIKAESPIKIEKPNGYNYSNYKIINGLKRKGYKDFNLYIKKSEYSSNIDYSNTLNTINTCKMEDENISNYRKYERNEIKPYFRKVIRNSKNNGSMNNFSVKKNLKQGLSQKTSTVSYFSLINKNEKRRELNSIITSNINLYDSNTKSRCNTNINMTVEKNGNNEDKENKMITITEKEIIQKINNYNNTSNIKKNIFNKNENNEENNRKRVENKEKIKDKDDKKMYEENKKEKEIKEENNNLEEKRNKNYEKKQIPEIYSYSSSNSFINKTKERERLLLNRMKNLKNRLDKNNNEFNDIDNKNKANKTEIINKKIDDENNKTENKYNNYSRINYKRRIRRKESKNEIKKEEKNNNNNNENAKENNNLKSNFISKRKYFLSNKKLNEEKVSKEEQTNHKKDKIYDNQITNSNKERKFKSIRYKYISKIQNKNNENKENVNEMDKLDNNKNSVSINEKREEKMNVNKSEQIKAEKEESNKIKKKDLTIETTNDKTTKSNAESIYPASSIFKLLHRTKTINDNNTQLTKEELNLELPNNYLYNYNKRNRILKTIRTIDHSESREKEKEPNIINKEVLLPKEISYNTIKTDINNKNNATKNNDRVIHSYHHRNLYKNKIRKNIDDNSNNNSNKNINIDTNTNKTANTIVINNNININFNNKIEQIHAIQDTYLRNSVLKRNITESNNNEFYDKIILNKTNNNSRRKAIIEKYNVNSNNVEKKRGKKYYTGYNGGTIECTNINKNENKNDSISSLLHRIPFYKKTLENNKKILSGENSFELK